MPLFAVTVFLSAFLLFQIQPMVAKMILPWFGGASSVWSTCLVFFQAELLLGYLYVHWLHETLSPRRQTLLHVVLLVASLAALPVAADPSWKETAQAWPTLSVLGVLATAVGLPYLLLSTTGPLMQAWYARAFTGVMPYRLYALSNLASMLALLSYPVAVEPFLAVRGSRGCGRRATPSSSPPAPPRPGGHGGRSRRSARRPPPRARPCRARPGANACCGSGWP